MIGKTISHYQILEKLGAGLPMVASAREWLLSAPPATAPSPDSGPSVVSGTPSAERRSATIEVP